MASEGHEVTVYVRKHYTPASLTQWQGVRLVHTPGVHTKNLDAITHTLTATLHALFSPYDVIHYQSIGPSVLSIIPRLFKRQTLVVATFHSTDYQHKKWGWFARTFLRFGEYMICRVPERTITVSRELALRVRAKYGRQAVYIPNGATVRPKAGTDRLAEFGLKENRYILTVSRLVAHKGIHHLIRAFIRLEDTNQLPNNFKLAIVGKEVDTAEYERYLKSLGENHDTIVFLGEQTGEALDQLFSSAYLFVQPSEEEGLSIALLEAMGYGLPVVVSDIPANIEAVGSTATTFASGDSEDLKKKLAYLLNRPRVGEELGRAARNRIETEFNWDSIARQTIATYVQTMERRSRLPREWKRKMITR
jgi:glycosyltransferase involved in cell wall biosynthesis